MIREPESEVKGKQGKMAYFAGFFEGYALGNPMNTAFEHVYRPAAAATGLMAACVPTAFLAVCNSGRPRAVRKSASIASASPAWSFREVRALTGAWPIRSP